MSLKFTHKPNYFLYADLLIKYIQGYVRKYPEVNNAIFDLNDIYKLFTEDYASTTVNLAGILNIADEYTVETINGDCKVILNHRIDVENHKLLVDFNQVALEGLRQGNPLITPDPTIQQ